MKYIFIILFCFACSKDINKTPGCWECEQAGKDTICGDNENDAKKKIVLEGIKDPPTEIFRQHCRKI